MMTSDEKTVIPSLLKYESSDLFTIGNISKSITVNLQNDDVRAMLNDIANRINNGDELPPYIPPHRWEVVLNYLPLEFYRLIESYQLNNNERMFYVEDFNYKLYRCNPKRYAFDKYGITNMWRPIMILNRCANITDFNFKFIRYYDIKNFSKVMSVLISRMQHDA